MNCYQAKAGELAKHWYLIDAEDMVVGRLAAQIAPILMGKHRPTYTPHIDTGDYVIVTNVDKVVFTGKKWRQKSYQRYSGYPGGQKRRGRLEAVRAPSRADPRAGHPADDAQEQDRPAHDGQAQALRRAEPSAPGSVPDPARAALGPSHPGRGCFRRPPQAKGKTSERAASSVAAAPAEAAPAAPPSAPTSPPASRPRRERVRGTN